MKRHSRRAFLVSSVLATTLLAACGSGGGLNSNRDDIDAAVRQAQMDLYATVPGSQEAASRAAGVLIMPSVTEGGLMIGGGYGEGALLIGDAPVEYFSVASASYGLQAGYQQENPRRCSS